MELEPENNDQDPSQMTTIGTYLALSWRIGWGLLVLFGIVGTLAGHDAGPYVVMLTATMWVSLKIIGEAVGALWLWKIIGIQGKLPEGDEAEETKDED
jgi:hypothetical protein